MDHSVEVLKQLVYTHYIDFVHLNEEMFEMELNEFINKAEAVHLSAFPKNLTSVHVIDCIGQHGPINNTTIAEKLNLSKASITKITAKLEQIGYVRRSQLSDNRKEVYFSLKEKGRRIFELHQTLHEQEQRRFLEFLERFSGAELEAILKFLQNWFAYLRVRQSQLK